MREVSGDLFYHEGDALVITTNGVVRKDGACVMGRGVAQQAAVRWPRLPFTLGAFIKRGGNHTRITGVWDSWQIIALPVKERWREPADPILIERSLDELVRVVGYFGYKDVALPRPGCGNGELKWEDVRPLLVERLDDRFVVRYLTVVRAAG